MGSNEKRCAHLEIPLVATFTKTLTLELARSLAPVAKTLALPLGKKNKKPKRELKPLILPPFTSQSSPLMAKKPWISHIEAFVATDRSSNEQVRLPLLLPIISLLKILRFFLP